LTETTLPAGGAPDSPRRANLSLGLLTAGTFLAFMTIGLPLPVIPLFVGHTLQFGNVLVGLAVGIQFLATVLTRGYAGGMADRSGACGVMLRGMLFCACSGLALILAASLPLPPDLRLAVLILSRLILGFGESQLVIGMFGWGIGTIGQARSGTAIAMTGMAMYGSIAAASPLGFWLYGLGGLAYVGGAIVLLPALGALLTLPVPAVAPHGGGPRQSFWRVMGLIWQPGLGVLLQGVGFAAIGAFVALDFIAKGWHGTALALTCFGAAFVLVRILFGRLPDRIGGGKVALVSLVIEAIGQTLLFLAPNAGIALLGATVTGFGCSMVFPGFGVEVVRRVPPQIRATALGGFAAYQDVAYGLTGPVTGLFATGFGYPAVFAVGAVCALGGIVMALAVVTGGLGWRPRA
jgi:MFS family permease